MSEVIYKPDDPNRILQELRAQIPAVQIYQAALEKAKRVSQAAMNFEVNL